MRWYFVHVQKARLTRQRRGLTLVELLAVMAIIGILAGVVAGAGVVLATAGAIASSID